MITETQSSRIYLLWERNVFFIITKDAITVLVATNTFTKHSLCFQKHCRITTRLAFCSIHLLGNRQSVRSVASLLGISDSFIFRRMKDISYPKPTLLPEVLSIDEFRENAGGQKFQAILTDAKNHKLFDILPTRSKTDLMLYLQGFQNKKQIKYFVTDMNTVYKDLAREYFPNATIVIDKFHVVRYVTWALENVRKRIQTKTFQKKPETVSYTQKQAEGRKPRCP